MRSGVYRAMSILAWPAAVWFAIEASLRAAIGDPAGALIAIGWFGLAAGTIAAARFRLSAHQF